MKILYDYQAFYMQKFGGVSNSFVQLIKRLPKDVQYEIAVRESENVHLRESSLKKTEPLGLVEENFISTTKFKGRGFLFRQFSQMFPQRTSLGRNRLNSIEILQRGDFDVFHPTFFDPYFLPYLNGKPFVLTVHDMIPELFWKKKRHDIQIRNKPFLCSMASHIIAVSENTKQDVIEMLNVAEEKITVVYHGVPEDIDTSGEMPIVTGRYILYVGQRDQYKYFSEMLIALAPVFHRHNELKLVCSGKPFTKNEATLIGKLKMNDSILQLYPSDHDLMNLYAHAVCFIYPSIYEGFGIPILEAYKAGCPVLLNHKSCFPEIAQEAAIYFHLDENQQDLTDVMERFLSITEYELKIMIERQNNRMKVFSWEASAKQLAEVYRRVGCGECCNRLYGR